MCLHQRANPADQKQLACEQALLFGQAKQASRERASEGPRKGELATISHKFSFLPRKPRNSDPQRVKTVTVKVPQMKSDNRLSSKFRQLRARRIIYI